ncbi:MAG: haloacid dehalogenase-like hydrolase [Solobacterium sp.]|nr:haloacid dehalogenase-like hydrolase [Solobacterium sp.]
MNVYDWDDTIYRGDSTFGLVLYSYAHRPKTLLSIPRTAVCGLLFVLHIMKKQTFKENMYHMFTFVDDMEDFIEEYTSSHLDHIKDLYRQRQREDDLVISASPEFLIRSFCEKAGIKACMASPVNMHTGKYEGLNCHGKEKVRRFYEKYPDGKIQEFYSDSYSDTPLAEISEKAYLVKGDTLKEWGK